MERSKQSVGVSWLAVLWFAALVLTWWLADGPIRSQPTGEQSVAAVAIRDHVIPFQKFGTKLFTVPTLQAHYDHLTYLTQETRGDKRREFVEAIEESARRHDAVDIWLLAHGNWFVFWLDELSPAARRKVRLVYNTGCANAYQARLWHQQGVTTYVGHPGRTSVSPLFYVFFARRYVRGWRVDEAVADANEQTTKLLRIFGKLTLGVFDGEGLAGETLGVATGSTLARVR